MADRASHPVPQAGENILFITGRLAESVTRHVVTQVSEEMGFTADVHVVGISVAALTHADWLNRKLTVEPTGFDAVYVPGWCQGDLTPLADRFGVPFRLGPKDILDLAVFFGQQKRGPVQLENYDIEIIAEINHAPRLQLSEILEIANRYRSDGADVIDVGCIPGESWQQTGDVVAMLVAEGFRVSIDSFDQHEVESAIKSGAELILSCNSSNVDWFTQFGVEVVAIPDDPAEMSTMWATADHLEAANCPYRLDPILEPIGFGFATSLARYYKARQQAPNQPIMMGIGNLTEMTEVDSAGVNALFAAICQELKIQSVLATEVIPWCQTAVREFDLARKLMRHAVENRKLPKHVSSDLVLLRDPNVSELGDAVLSQMATGIRDANYRIFVERGEIHVMNRNGYWRGKDAFEIFDDFVSHDQSLDVSHSFYLGYELAKAITALTLGKQYRQDQALNWGFLTVPEQSVHERRKLQKKEAAKRKAESDA